MNFINTSPFCFISVQFYFFKAVDTEGDIQIWKHFHCLEKKATSVATVATLRYLSRPNANNVILSFASAG